MPSAPAPAPTPSHRIVIIGAGPGGLCMGIRLRQAGIEDFVILDKASGVGGTWFHNRYPGCAVDLPSFLYSFSFEKKYDWPRPYAPQSELLAYMEGVAEKYGLLALIVAWANGVRSGLVWQDDEASWRLELESGRRSRGGDRRLGGRDVQRPRPIPEIEGRDAFEGDAFHSARWDERRAARRASGSA